MNIVICDRHYVGGGTPTSWKQSLESCATFGFTLTEQSGTFNPCSWECWANTSVVCFVHTDNYLPWVNAARSALAANLNDSRHIVLVRQWGGLTIPKEERRDIPSLIHECEWTPLQFGNGIASAFFCSLTGAKDWQALDGYLHPFNVSLLENYAHSVSSRRPSDRIKLIYDQLHTRISEMSGFKPELANIALPAKPLSNKSDALKLVTIAVTIAKI